MISLGDFDRWIMSVSWNLHKSVPVDSRVYSLIRDIESSISEYQHGEYDAAELRHELEALTPAAHISVLMFVSSNTPVNVSLNFDPEPRQEIKTVATPPQWCRVPELAQV